MTQASERDLKYQTIMRNLVRRYVTQVNQDHEENNDEVQEQRWGSSGETVVDNSLFQEQRKAENEGVTEDDVNEIKNDISAFRFSKIISIVISEINTD